MIVATSARARRPMPRALRAPDRSWLRRAVWVLVPLVVVLLAWQPLPLEPRPGLDNSWHAALHMALHTGIGFGNHLIFTYGPLGFLSVPTFWYSDTGTIAVLYTVLLRVALAAAIFAGARRSYGTLIGALLALLVVGTSGIGFQEEFPTLGLEAVPFLIFAVWVVDRVSDPRHLLAFVALGGAIAGVELLNKLSVGLDITVLALIMALCARGRRWLHLAVTLGALVATVLLVWGLTGQSFGALPSFARNGAQIVSGYGLAMSYEEAGLGWQFAAGAAVFVVGVIAALQMTSESSSKRRRWGIVALWVAFCFFAYKDGYVRHDYIHASVFFVAMLGGFFAFTWRGRWRLVGAITVVALFAFALLAQRAPVSEVLEPGRASTAVEQVADAFDPAEQRAIIASGRSAIALEFPVDERTLALMNNKTVHVSPYEASIAWAYNLRWRPLPVFQSYSAYTTALDEADEHAIRSRDAPQRILNKVQTEGDGRVVAFDQPLTSRAILCRYVELNTTSEWQLLGLGPNRCGAAVPLETVHANWGQSVLVPPPPNGHSLVFARIGGVDVSGFESLVSLLYRPTLREILLEGVPYRLIAGTAADGLILRAPAAVDFSAPYNLARNASTIAVRKLGQLGEGSGRPITYSFFAAPVTRGPRDPALQRAIIGSAGSG